MISWLRTAVCVALFEGLENDENRLDAISTWPNPTCRSRILVLRTGIRQRSIIEAWRLKTVEIKLISLCFPFLNLDAITDSHSNNKMHAQTNKFLNCLCLHFKISNNSEV